MGNPEPNRVVLVDLFVANDKAEPTKFRLQDVHVRKISLGHEAPAIKVERQLLVLQFHGEIDVSIVPGPHGIWRPSIFANVADIRSLRTAYMERAFHDNRLVVGHEFELHSWFRFGFLDGLFDGLLDGRSILGAKRCRDQGLHFRMPRPRGKHHDPARSRRRLTKDDFPDIGNKHVPEIDLVRLPSFCGRWC